jgi:aquaporin Z
MVIPKFECKLFISEAIGTALLTFFSLSIVILNSNEASLVAKYIPSQIVRGTLTGFFYGLIICLIALSPVGKISGAHINPAVSIAFWMRGKMQTATMMGYVVSQMIGAVIGCLPLLLWGEKGRSIQYGISQPGKAGVTAALLAEIFATGCLITYLYVFVGKAKLRKFTPLGLPVLYCVLSLLLVSFSGSSTNAARCFGPAVLTENFHYYWLYWLGPLIAVILVSLYFRRKRINRVYEMKSARISYHNSPTPESLQRGELRDVVLKGPG